MIQLEEEEAKSNKLNNKYTHTHMDKRGKNERTIEAL